MGAIKMNVFTISFLVIVSLIWGVFLGYAVPAFIDWTKREAAKLEKEDA